MREIENDRAAGRFSVIKSKNELRKEDYKNKKSRVEDALSLPRGKDPGLARGTSHSQAVSAVRQKLETGEMIANAPKQVKGVYDNLVDIVRSIENGHPVMGMGKPVTESNFLKALFRAGINTQSKGETVERKKAGESSGYLTAEGRTTRVSTHPVEAEYFLKNGTDNNVSFVIRKPSVVKPMTPNGKANVLEIVFNRASLRNNPEDMARIVHDIARFVATGEYNDTIGAAKYNYSGSKEFIANAMRSLIHDAEMREDAKTENEIRKEAKRREIDLAQPTAKMSVSPVYTGSAADYEKPSLLKIGTGEGSQVYGWGLYGSTVRGVAESYTDSSYDKNTWARNYLAKNGGNRDAAIKELKYASKYVDGEAKKAALDAAKLIASGKKIPQGGNLYSQTFFTNRAPGDESHLLNWYEPVNEENVRRVIDQYAKEHNGEEMLSETPSGTMTAEDFGSKKEFEKAKKELRAEISERGEGLYKYLSGILGGEKSASEFLARADIDGIKYPVNSYGGKGVKDGDTAGWNYVSFRDDNIRVDHKWRDGEAVFQAGKEAVADPDVFVFDPNAKITLAMGEKEGNAAGAATMQVFFL